VIRGCGFFDSLNQLSKTLRWKRGKEDNHTHDEIIMEMAFWFPIEMSDYNQNSKNFMSSVYNKKYLGEAPCNGV
jgi:hypothetical protein